MERTTVRAISTHVFLRLEANQPFGVGQTAVRSTRVPEEAGCK